jgi:hypothetical protein
VPAGAALGAAVVAGALVAVLALGAAGSVGEAVAGAGGDAGGSARVGFGGVANGQVTVHGPILDKRVGTPGSGICR